MKTDVEHAKKIMEGCKERALMAGLRFPNETLEYIVTNRDMLELAPKMMIPTLYDYWVHEVEVLQEKGRYELYPSNPYETVINTRPAISFYNDNNPDWLNVMIFYHVLAHIDFFQSNIFYRHTWDYDFSGQALSDKRLIARLRSEKGRWVDYVIEFARGIDNLVGYHDELYRIETSQTSEALRRLDYYFDVFLQKEKQVPVTEYIKNIELYNELNRKHGDAGEKSFFAEVIKNYPEFETVYRKSIKEDSMRRLDLLQHLLDHSKFLNAKENRWMKSIVEIIRNTSLFFQPQIRTKIMNEGWASYWHETLFLEDERIRGHEVDYARTNAFVTSMPRVGLNPYALGLRLFSYIEEMADKGKLDMEYRMIRDQGERARFDRKTGRGRRAIFSVRENFSDFTFINTFVDQDFLKRHKLFVAGRRLDPQKMVWEYFIKSRKAEDYKQMIFDTLHHPPKIDIDPAKSEEGSLYLNHRFEGRPLVKDFIANTMLGIEYLWGAPVKLETSEVVEIPNSTPNPDDIKPSEMVWQRVVYTMKGRKLSKTVSAKGERNPHGTN